MRYIALLFLVLTTGLVACKKFSLGVTRHTKDLDKTWTLSGQYHYRLASDSPVDRQIADTSIAIKVLNKKQISIDGHVLGYINKDQHVGSNRVTVDKKTRLTYLYSNPPYQVLYVDYYYKDGKVVFTYKDETLVLDEYYILTSK